MSKDRQAGVHHGLGNGADRLLTKLEAAELLNVRPRFIERCIAKHADREQLVGDGTR